MVQGHDANLTFFNDLGGGGGGGNCPIPLCNPNCGRNVSFS